MVAQTDAHKVPQWQRKAYNKCSSYCIINDTSISSCLHSKMFRIIFNAVYSEQAITLRRRRRRSNSNQQHHPRPRV
jgi:hypothetical protein